ncbi:hypothetical protein CspHIS471_0209950 [Cutaneotrichosporon sp. HIS471]|nr:hypothetical protein CspHIS471_0209950 [Cutaneotrichosporon sp. HIS471]
MFLQETAAGALDGSIRLSFTPKSLKRNHITSSRTAKELKRAQSELAEISDVLDQRHWRSAQALKRPGSWKSKEKQNKLATFEQAYEAKRCRLKDLAPRIEGREDKDLRRLFKKEEERPVQEFKHTPQHYQDEFEQEQQRRVRSVRSGLPVDEGPPIRAIEWSRACYMCKRSTPPSVESPRSKRLRPADEGLKSPCT